MVRTCVSLHVVLLELAVVVIELAADGVDQPFHPRRLQHGRAGVRDDRGQAQAHQGAADIRHTEKGGQHTRHGGYYGRTWTPT